MVLFFLIGLGTKSYGQAAGDYVFTQASSPKDSLWSDVNNWSTSDGAGNFTVATRTPQATDNVWIPAGKIMYTVGAKTSVSGVILTAGSTTATLAAATTSITVGMAVKLTSSTIAGVSVSTIIGLTPGTYVTAINGTTVTLSQPALTSGSMVSLDFYTSCKNLNVSGFFRASSQFVAFGDITVNAGGLLTQLSSLYCANINNYGTFNASTNYRSAQVLYVGYNGTVPGTGSYTIINDGVFGDSKPNVPAGAGSGIKVNYSNQASSVTIKTSTPSVTGYAFNISQLVPTAYNKTAVNSNLNIKETMSLLLHNGIGFSIQNNDTCPGTTRTCTIDPGVSVYLGYRFHSNGAVTTNDQGNFTYNVYGTLDLGTHASAGNTLTASATNVTDFGLCMTSVVGNTGTLTFNLGDGSQANAGTLILGSNVKLMKLRTQTIAMNFNDNSTVQVTGNYGQGMNYQLLNSNVPAMYLFPKNFYNLTLNGAGAILPLVPAIKGTKTYTDTYATVVAPATTPVINWIPATSAVQGSILFTGSSYYYVPVVRTTSSYKSGDNPLTLVGDTIFQYIKPGLTVNGSGITNFTVTSLTGNSLLMSAAVATMTPSSVTNSLLSFTGGKSAALAANAPTGTSTDTNAPVLDGTQFLIYLGGTDFPTNSTTIATAVNIPSTNNVLVYSDQKNSLVISNAVAGDIASVYSISGIKVASAKLTSDKTTLSIPTGIYLVKINASVSKVIVR